MPVPEFAVTVHVWLYWPLPLCLTDVIDVPARVPKGTSVNFAAVTPLTGSLKSTVHVTLEAVVGVGVPGGLCAGFVSIEVTIGAEGEGTSQGPKTSSNVSGLA